MSKAKSYKIVRGGDFSIPFVLTQDGLQQPLDSPSEITVLLPSESSASLALKASDTKVVITSDARGEFKAVGDEAESLTLNPGTNQDIVVKIKRGTEDIIRVLSGVLDIEDPPLSEPAP